MVERELPRSYVHGTGPTPLVADTVGACLRRAARAWPESEALVVPYQGVRWSFAELDRRVDAVAAGLLELGLEPGERVMVWSPNRAEWVLAQFATARAGLILVNANPAWRLAEIEGALRAIGASALITAERLRDADYLAMLRELCPELEAARGRTVRCARLPALRRIIHLGTEHRRGMVRFADLAGTDGAVGPPASAERAARLEELERDASFDAPVNIQFTSGTTGAPKAATLSHHAIVNNARLVGERMRLGPGDRLCIPVPMYHCFGMVLGTLTCVVRGATMVFAAEGFDAGAVLDVVESERCTALHGVPTMFVAVLEHPDFAPARVQTLRTGIMAGAPCPEALMRRAIAELHLPEITIAYGMTETGPVSFQSTADDSPQRRVTTVGTVLAHTEVRVVDAAGRLVPRGAVGELHTRGYSVMRGYWSDPERTAEALDADGWLASGDLVTLDADGYCAVVGRVKDIVIRGGENLYPREIEDVLYECSGVDEAEVFGVPDERYGEELCAWVKPRPGVELTVETLREHCAARLAHFKVPRYVRLVDAYPLTVTGKVRKQAMREQMARELAAGVAAAPGSEAVR